MCVNGGAIRDFMLEIVNMWAVREREKEGEGEEGFRVILVERRY